MKNNGQNVCIDVRKYFKTTFARINNKIRNISNAHIFLRTEIALQPLSVTTIDYYI